MQKAKKILILIFIVFGIVQVSLAQKLSATDQKIVNNLLKEVAELEKGDYNNDEISFKYQTIAIYYSRAGDPDNAIVYFKKAIDATDNNNVSLSRNNELIGQIYEQLNQYQQAQSYNLESLKYAKMNGDPNMIYKSQMKVAETYVKINKYLEAIQYYEDALHNAENRGSTPDMKKTLTGLSTAYNQNGEQKKANIAFELSKKSNITASDLEQLWNPLPHDPIVNENVSTINIPNEFTKEVAEKMQSNEEFRDSVLQYYSKITQNQVSELEKIKKKTKQKLDSVNTELEARQNKLSELNSTVETQGIVIILTVSLLGLIAILTAVILVAFRNKRKQNQILEQQKQEIQEQAKKLDKNNQELQKTLEELKSTQNQLIQSEKMASLGKLVANIAHELNTPLGAINSSISTLEFSADNIIKMLPQYLKNATEEQYTLMLNLVQTAIQSNQYVSSREVRKLKRKIRQKLDDAQIEKSDYIAGLLAEIGLHDNYEKYFPLFQSSNVEQAMETSYNLTINSKIRQNIKSAIDKASKIIYALKSYSHSGSTGEKNNADIRKNIDNVLTIYQNQLKYGINLIKNYDEIPEIMCYPDDLSQVWTNLIHNSLQAMDGKGELKIDITQDNKSINIAITDDGCGIPDNIKNKIFTPFFTTKPEGEGTGLGLDIVKTIVEKHGGKIDFISQEKLGTTFNVSIPKIEG